MQLRFCANAAFFGLRRDRFCQYQPQRSVQEKLDLTAKVEGVSGVELKYPFDFDDRDATVSLLKRLSLELAAVNVDLRESTLFPRGALSSRDAAARAAAVTRVHDAMDLAADLGCGLVTTCPVAEGYDYPFQIDYGETWSRMVDSVGSAAAHRSDVRLCLEYQPHEPHASLLIDSAAKALTLVLEIASPNLGVNLDVGHAFARGENPAESAALLARHKRLFYIHTNDNPGDGGDWDMVSGTVHLWHWLELLLELDRIGYAGWLGGDIQPKQWSPDEGYSLNARMIRRMASFLDRVGPEKIRATVREGRGTGEIFELLSSELLGT